MALEIKNLSVSVEKKPIVTGLSLAINPGEVHVIMGPNGSGKSTLANALAGHPKYTVTNGTINLDGTNITNQAPDKRAKAGLFLSMQNPPEIPGVSIANFLRLAVEAATGQKKNPMEFYPELTAAMKSVGLNESFAKRLLNAGFSGGEKKKMEIVQLLLLQPRYAVLDETDSGLDVDALKVVAEGINRFRSAKTGILLITHYNRLPSLVSPNFVHIMSEGKIIKSGGKELANEIENAGYSSFHKK